MTLSSREPSTGPWIVSTMGIGAFVTENKGTQAVSGCKLRPSDLLKSIVFTYMFQQQMHPKGNNPSGFSQNMGPGVSRPSSNVA